jgi:hypothetical protein
LLLVREHWGKVRLELGPSADWDFQGVIRQLHPHAAFTLDHQVHRRLSAQAIAPAERINMALRQPEGPCWLA